jgi:hypothetical protein
VATDSLPFSILTLTTLLFSLRVIESDYVDHKVLDTPPKKRIKACGAIKIILNNTGKE